MPSKTFIPAFKAHVGQWEYYMCLMSYAQVAREISFAYELGGNSDLNSMIQRGVSARTDAIKDYLLTNERRFLGSLIVAVWGGHPEYVALRMDNSDDQGMLEGVDRGFGVLTFDGTHQFFALDGQHRLRAIKDAIKKNPELGSEDIGVIVVPHFNTDEGRQITRRLFSNINRNAVKTTLQENIALDEDDGFAIITRRFLEEHDFLGKDGVVQVFSKQGSDGELKLATRQVPVGGKAWTTIGVLYDMLKELGRDLDGSMHRLTQRASDDVLEASYEILKGRIEQLLSACGDLETRYKAAISGKEVRAPKNHEGDGHPFMRPVVQLAIARAVMQVVEQGLLSWEGALERLGGLEWRMGAVPFSAVWQETPNGRVKGKMITGKDDTELLRNLLIVHLAPTTKAQIDRVLKSYRGLRGSKYPIAMDEFVGRILTPQSTVGSAAPPDYSKSDVDSLNDVASESEDEVLAETDGADVSDAEGGE